MAPAWRIALLYAGIRTATELTTILHGPASTARSPACTGTTALLLAGLATSLLTTLRPPNRDCQPRAWQGIVAGAVPPLAAGSAGCYLAAAALSGQLGTIWRW